MLVDPDHHIARLDDSVSGLALGELQFVDRLVGDRSGYDRAAHIDPDMGGGGALVTSTTVPLSRLRALIFITGSRRLMLNHRLPEVDAQR